MITELDLDKNFRANTLLPWPQYRTTLDPSSMVDTIESTISFKAIVCQYIGDIKLHHESTQGQDIQEILKAMEDAAYSYKIMMESHCKLQAAYTHFLNNKPNTL